MKISALSRINPIQRMTEAHSMRLITECIAGNEDAVEILVRQYETSVFRLALSIVGDEAEANEITQETFLSALRAMPSYQEKTSFKAWLYTIAVNHSRSHLRKQKVIERLRATLTSIFQVETQRQVSPEEVIIRDETEAAIWHSLRQLDEHHRIVIVLRYFHELSIAEISEVLTINEGTIHSRLYYAREKLRAALEHLHGE